MEGTLRPVVKFRPMLVAAILCAAFTIPIAWNAREGISSDGLSYLEVAVNAIQLGPQYLFSNGYWSPAYPALLALALKLTHPAMAAELAVVHTVDWAICAAAYLAFTYFLFNLLQWIELGREPDFLSVAGFRSILVFAYTLLFISNIDSSLWYVGPNILMEGAVYLIAGLCVRLSLPDTRRFHYVAFGIALAFGYAAKAVLFPLSLVLLAFIFIFPLARGSRKGVAIATLSFLLASSPLVAFLSYNKGRVTFGDAGTLTYAWYVNNVPRSVLWQGRLPGGAVLLHPPERISIDPAIVKFDGPGRVKSAYPYWYDPSYWYDGLKSHLDVRRQLQQLLRSFGLAPKVMLSGYTIFQLARLWTPMFAGLLAFAALGLTAGNVYKAIRPHLWLFLWPAFALLTFACVLIEYRYIVPFAVLAWTTLFAAAWMALKTGPWIGVTLTVTAGLLLAYCPNLAKEVIHNQMHPHMSNMTVANNMAAMGIRPGDELASLNFADGTYYARLAGARFTQEIWTDDPAALAGLPGPQVERLIASLRANGAKALFSQWRPAFDNDSGWSLLTEHTYIRMIQ